jgi:DNA mismatch endonuclease Vsr
MRPDTLLTSRADLADISDARRRNMAAIRGRNTQPEIKIRQILHSGGYRYRLHSKGLPGRPDIVLPARRKIIEVRGCFWHRHSRCPLAATPQTRQDFWKAKFQATVARDARNLARLEACGWAVMVIWECELKDANLADRLRTFLGPKHGTLGQHSFDVS